MFVRWLSSIGRVTSGKNSTEGVGGTSDVENPSLCVARSRDTSRRLRNADCPWSVPTIGREHAWEDVHDEAGIDVDQHEVTIDEAVLKLWR